MIWRIVYSKISSLGSKWRSLEEQYEASVFGKKKQEPRYEQCVDVVQSAIGIALSNLYVKTYFANENKQMVTIHLMLFKKILSKKFSSRMKIIYFSIDS
jgi:predicted metalloendopeptidase